MKTLFSKPLFVFALLAFVGCVSAPQSATQQAAPGVAKAYRIVELLPKGAKANDILAINRKFDAVAAIDTHLYYYKDGKMRNFIGPDKGSYDVRGLSNKGDIIGDYIFKEHSTAFVLRNGKRILLRKQGGIDSHAYGINDRGDIVGSLELESGKTRAFVYRNGKMQDIGTLGGEMSEALIINNKGDVAGAANPPPGLANHVFLYRNNKMRDLGTLGTHTVFVGAMNENGDIVGGANVKNGSVHAYLYHNEKFQDLGDLGGDYSGAESINNHGVIVGSTSVDVERKRRLAFIYADGKMVDLNLLLPANSGWKLTNAFLINDSGAIVGYGIHKGKGRIFLMQPTAAPAANSVAPGK